MTRVGRRGLILGPVTIKDGAPAPVNTVAPAIASSAVIGTALNVTPGTWTGATTLTYQWQRNTGSWVNISGATNTSYTPVDADFGRALRVVETADGSVSANSNETGLTAEAPAQSLSAELLTNGDFSAWTGDNPDWWATVGESGSDPMVTQVAPDGSAGTGAARYYSSSTNFMPRLARNGLCTVGEFYETQLDLSAYTSGALVATDASTAGFGGFPITTVGQKRQVGRCANTSYDVRGWSPAPNDFVLNNISLKLVTLNTQLTAPAANMRITQLYTLPGSPIGQDCVWLLPRVSDFAAGNYWLVWLRYTGAQWDINLYSVATNTRTSRIAATNIGTTNGIRINANGDDWSLYTTADNGDNWTQRGSTITNATYNTATGVNVLHTSSVTAGNLLYAPAT